MAMASTDPLKKKKKKSTLFEFFFFFQHSIIVSYCWWFTLGLISNRVVVVSHHISFGKQRFRSCYPYLSYLHTLSLEMSLFCKICLLVYDFVALQSLKCYIWLPGMLCVHAANTCWVIYVFALWRLIITLLYFPKRFNDIHVPIRLECVKFASHCLMNHPDLAKDLTGKSAEVH